MSPEERAARGERAKQLLEDRLLSEAFADLEAQYIQVWRGAKTLEAREDAHRYVTLLEKFKGHLGSQVATGSLARKELAEISGRKSFPF